MFQIEDTITPAFQHLYPVIEPLDEATGIMIPKVICNTVHMMRHQLEKSIEAGQSTRLDGRYPLLQVRNRLGLRVGRFKDFCQRLTECRRLTHQCCGGKETLTHILFFRCDIGWSSPKIPHYPFQEIIFALLAL